VYRALGLLKALHARDADDIIASAYRDISRPPGRAHIPLDADGLVLLCGLVKTRSSGSARGHLRDAIHAADPNISAAADRFTTRI
jgi:hypothetical protein